MRYLMLLITITLLAACSSQQNKLWDSKKTVTLTVLTFYEQYFMEQYVLPFSENYYHVKFNTIQLPRNEKLDWQKALADHEPDIVHIMKNQYDELVELELLKDLETVMEQEWKIETMHPAAAYLLRDNKDERVYGGATTLQSKALYYNIDLFEKYFIDVPVNDMTWEEMFRLATLFGKLEENGEQVFGYAVQNNSIFEQLMQMGRSEGLSMFSNDGLLLQFASPSWKVQYEMLINALKSNALYILAGQNNSREAMYTDHPFSRGKVAMMVGNLNYINVFEAIESRGEIPLNWGVVTIPQGSAKSGQSSEYELTDILSVVKQSDQTNMAEDFITYVLGEEWAASHVKRNPEAILVRNDVTRTDKRMDRSIDVFSKFDYLPKPKTPPMSVEYLLQLEQIVQHETEKAVNEMITVDEAIENIQLNGQAALSRE